MSTQTATKPRQRNGKLTLDEYVVTVRAEHFVVVKAANAEQAGKRALREYQNRWGVGRRPEVTEVEVLGGS